MSDDPEVSEWGNPAGKPPVIRARIHNAWRGTRGTETSKYPEEEKETSISRVAASETERVQTGMRAIPGLRTARSGRKLGERLWESRPERVKAPYPKAEGSGRDPEYRETRETLREAGGTTPQG